MLQILSELSTAMGSFVFLWAMLDKLPFDIEPFLNRQFQKVIAIFNPYLEVTFHEFTGKWQSKNEAYTAIDTFLSDMSTARAKALTGRVPKPGLPISLSMDDHEQVSDEFQGSGVVWTKVKITPRNNSISFHNHVSNDKRYFRLAFHRRHRDLILGDYLSHVLSEGRAVLARTRQRKLHTNNSEDEDNWNSVVFEHPASFETLAMDPAKKKEIMDDLVTFREAKQYYSKIGKPWKRGYLLYGPPGTGKSTMIAAIANFLNYDIYDLELTAVKSNTELRSLLIDTSSKSIIVIEDIDCSLDLTGQRKKGSVKSSKDRVLTKIKAVTDDDEEAEEKKKEKSKVTLSGLLNFIDGIWSGTCGERLIIFTTNHKDKLDEALIRRGRMDKHIELSYCDFESFKILANNYLSLESHPLFDSIQTLLGEAEITPADVAENLMPKTPVIKDGDKDGCLENLIRALNKKKVQQKQDQEQDQEKEQEQEQEKSSEVEKEKDELKPKPKENGKVEKKFEKSIRRRFWRRT